MNYSESARLINIIRKDNNKKIISVPTATKYLKSWKTIDEIAELECKLWGNRGEWNTWNYKLTPKDFERAKYLLKSWMSPDTAWRNFWVSRRYFDYHKDKLWL